MYKLIFLLVLIMIVFGGCEKNWDSVSTQNHEIETVYINPWGLNYNSPEILEIKIYLVKKYNPGICIGMPTVYGDWMIQSALGDTAAVCLIKDQFNVTRDFEIFTKIQQLNSVQVWKENNKYIFRFTDGQCCSLTHYEGYVSQSRNNFIEVITKQFSENVPC